MDKEIPQDNLIVDVYGNTDNDENEVQDMIVEEEDIEMVEELDIIEEEDEVGLQLVEMNNIISDEEAYADNQEEDEETLPKNNNEEQETEFISQIHDTIEEDITITTGIPN